MAASVHLQTEKSEPVGNANYYYPNGKLYVVKKFKDDVATPVEYRDSTGSVLATNGSGKWVERWQRRRSE